MLVFLLVALSVLAATIPMFTFLGVVWWLDRYDREPIWMVALTFFWGAFGGAGLSLLGNTSLHLLIAGLLGAEQAEWMGPVLVAPLIEEPTKAEQPIDDYIRDTVDREFLQAGGASGARFSFKPISRS